jgi:TolA-binding protein
MATLTQRAGWREHPVLLSGAVVVSLLIAFAIAAATLDIIAHLHMMTDQLGVVGQRLNSLDAMSRKLDRLTPMEQRLDHMNGSLTTMEGSLQQTNAKLDQMRVLTADMQKLDGDLRSMRGDIHVMAHKIGGSFLFRAVK